MLDTADVGHFDTNIEAYEREEIAGAKRELPLPHVEALTAVQGPQTQQPRFRTDRSGIRETPQIAKTVEASCRTISKGRGQSLGSPFCVPQGVQERRMTSPRTVEALASMAKLEHVIRKFRAVVDTGSSIPQICGVRCTQHSISIFSLQKADCR